MLTPRRAVMVNLCYMSHTGVVLVRKGCSMTCTSDFSTHLCTNQELWALVLSFQLLLTGYKQVYIYCLSHSAVRISTNSK